MATYILTAAQLNSRILNSFSIPSSGGPVIIVDPDAQAFITAAAITDTTQQAAIDNLVIGLKADSLWINMKAIYPFVGGTASAHKYNLKDPRDLDAAYRLSFSGGWTHNANGITGNGVNTYAQTYNNSASSLGAYSRVSGIFLGFDVVSQDNECIPTNPYGMILGGSFVKSLVYNVTPGGAPYTKFYSVTDNGSSLADSVKIYRNGTDILAGFPQYANWPKGGLNNYVLGAIIRYEYDCDGILSNSYVYGYDVSNIAFTYFSDSVLDATQNLNLNNRIETFQTSLNRNV
jgi:hypothetical protein